MNQFVRIGASGVIAAALAGCGGGAATSAPTGPVNAELKEFSITLSRSTSPAGAVAFAVRNAGTLVHEFVVIDTDTLAASLPVAADGTVNEDGLTVVDEIEDIAVGATPTLSVSLAAGHYAIICNVPGHYAGGMHVDFTAQ
jgi:uncharacterized cupredoxin-like copper-binding protein